MSSAPISAFAAIQARPPSISKQFAAASSTIPADDASVPDLVKISWKNRRFIPTGVIHTQKSRGRRSWIADYGFFMTELEPDNRLKQTVWCCGTCDARGQPQFFVASSTSSSSIEHLFKKHSIVDPEQSEQQQQQGPNVLKMQSTAARRRPASALAIPRTRIDRLKELCAYFVINSSLPFAIFEDPYLQDLLVQFNPALQQQVPFGRTAIRNEIEALFLARKQVVRKAILNARTAIHFSFDLWTSPNRLAFIAIIVHYLDGTYQPAKRMIAFKQQSGTHAGLNLAETLIGVIQDWGFGERLGVAICDNATNNDTCLQSLYSRLFPHWDRDAIRSRRMRCFGHILNLAAKAFLFGDRADEFEQQAETLEALEVDELDATHWRTRGPIGKLHNIVRFIRASPQRSEAFRKTERDDRSIQGSFLLAEATTKELELKQNNATRWNSTFLMIERACLLRNTIENYLTDLDLDRTATNKVSAEDRLSLEDWRLLAEVQEILTPFYRLTMITQGQGQLHEVLTGMEYVLDKLERWKQLYIDESLNPAVATEPVRPPTRSRPLQRNRAAIEPGFTSRFNEEALPDHTRLVYTNLAAARAAGNFDSLGAQQRSFLRSGINNAWLKLNHYYTSIGESSLFTSAVILHPGLGLGWLENVWTAPEQVIWISDAKRALKAYLEAYYPEANEQGSRSPSAEPEPVGQGPPKKRKVELEEARQWIAQRCPQLSQTASELEVYFRTPRENTEDPIQWWRDHQATYPRLSCLALDLLAIPAMADDCERAFSIAKLTVTSQRHSLSSEAIEYCQLLKNWLYEDESRGQQQLQQLQEE